MPHSPHLLVALSGHGFGHLAQVAPVINALRVTHPDIRLTVQSALPRAVLQSRIKGDFDHVEWAADFGMIMANPLEVRLEETRNAYRDFHHHLKALLAKQQAILAAHRPDLIVANIPYLTLAAADRLQIAAVALCSLNWSDVLAGYFPDDSEITTWRAQMIDFYNRAAVFLRLTPAMPMPNLHNLRDIGPIAAQGRHCPTELRRQLGLPDRVTLIGVALGGIPMNWQQVAWPTLPNCHWLFSEAPLPAVKGCHLWPAGLSGLDVIQSCEVLLTKPGYGSFTEAACAGTPVLYIERDDWPEEPFLSRWLAQYGNACRIPRMALERGDVADYLATLLAQPRKPNVIPSGIAEAVECLEKYL